MSKHLRRSRRVVLVVAACAATAIVATLGIVWFVVKGLPPAAAADLDEVDTALFDQLTEQFRAAADHPDALWTADYRYDKQPMIFIRADSASSPVWHYVYLVNASAVTDTSGAQKMNFPDNPHLTDVYVTKSLGLASLEYWQPFTFTTTTLGETPMLAMKYAAETVDDIGDPLSETPSFALHETFHISKQARWDYDRSEVGTRIFDYPSDPAQMDLLRTEFAILDGFTGLTDPAEVSRVGRDLLAVRAARYARWPQLIAQDNAEAIEGTAQYVERRMSDLTDGRIGILTNRDGQPSTFTDVFAWIELDDSRRELLERSLSYETGAQLGYALDVILPSWKTLIEPGPTGQGLTPHAALVRALGDPGEPTAAQIEEIQARYR